MLRIFAILLAIEATAVQSADGAQSPSLQKVITMLEDLQVKVITEGKEEAKTYDKFACFCKDVTDEKTESITTGQDEQQSLMADIEALTSTRQEQDDTIASATKRIAEVEKEISEAMAARHKEKIEYDKNVVDMDGALQALESAIATLKASKPKESLAALHSVIKTVRKATLIADVLGIGSAKTQRTLASLLQDQEIPSSTYESHSDEIIETLEKLLDDFKAQKTQIDEEEVKEVEAHDKKIQALESEKKSKAEEMETAKADKATAQEEIAQKSQDLSTTSATLLDDQEYLKDLAAKCEEKSKAWDQRTKGRSDELNALTTAVGIIKGIGGGEEGEFLQKKARGHWRHVHPVALPVVAEAATADVAEEDTEETPLGFLQLTKPRAMLSALSRHSFKGQQMSQEALEAGATSESEMKKMQVVSLLKSEAQNLKSELLAKLVSKVAADPFAKVKKLIQELIERLLQEAAEEANHKGWCDKEMGKAKQTRGYKSDDILKLNSQLAMAEATRDKLTEETDKLSKEIKSDNEEMGSAEEMRGMEKEENEATIKEAKEAVDAVAEAIDVLEKHYKTAAKGGSAALIQDTPDMPDAGFEGDYKGQQSASTGVIGMLEVVKSDFQRTVDDTEKAEAQSAQDYMEFERTMKTSLATKNVALKEKSAALGRTQDTISTDMESLLQAQSMLDKSLQELQELHGACVDTGMSYEEKAAQREQEIEALKKALCILDEKSPVQTEDC